MSNLLHSFLKVHNCVASFTGHSTLQEFGAEKPISWAKLAHFDFFSIIFTIWSHMLCTVGDALTRFILGKFQTSEQALNYFKYVYTWQLDLNKDLILILCHIWLALNLALQFAVTFRLELAPCWTWIYVLIRLGLLQLKPLVEKIQPSLGIDKF
jgi:hypothetical protein